MAELTDDAALVEQVKPYTKSSPERIASMMAAVRHIDSESIPGAIVECGVWRGGNIIIARKLSPQRECWLYDTFAGMTEPGEFDSKSSGAMAIASYRHKEALGVRWAEASVDEVRSVLFDAGTLDDAKLRFVVGDVAETLRVAANLPEKIALLRLDTDWYASTKVEIEVLYPLLQVGGVLIVDDYGHWMGARKAVDDYFGGTVDLQRIDYTAVMMVKPC